MDNSPRRDLTIFLSVLSAIVCVVFAVTDIRICLYIIVNIESLCTISYLVDLLILFSFLYYTVSTAVYFYQGISLLYGDCDI